MRRSSRSRRSSAVRRSQPMARASTTCRDFPGLFKGALEARATRFTDEMLMAASTTLSRLAGPDALLPDPLDLEAHARSHGGRARRSVNGTRCHRALTGRGQRSRDLPVDARAGDVRVVGGMIRGARRRPAFRWRTSDMTRFRITVAAVAAVAVHSPAARRWTPSRTTLKRPRHARGAGYGAAAGAVVGLLTAGSNPFKSAMIGAAAGALVGGAVGQLHGQAGSEAAPADGRHRRRCRAQRRHTSRSTCRAT